MNITIQSGISFISHSDIPYTVKVKDANGVTKEVLMNNEEYQNYMKQQEAIREQEKQQEELKKQQDWLALINKPQTYKKEN